MVRTAGAVGGLGLPGAAGDGAVQEHIRPTAQIQAALNHILVGIPLHPRRVHGGAGENTHQQCRNGAGNQGKRGRGLLPIGGAGVSLPNGFAVLGRFQIFLACVQIFAEAAVEIIPPEMEQKTVSIQSRPASVKMVLARLPLKSRS